MKPEEIEKLIQNGTDRFQEMMRRPQECSRLEMELKSAIEVRDISLCRELLRSNGQWLAKFKSHELAELLDAAIHSGEVAHELVDLLLHSGVPAHCVYDSIGEEYQHTPLVTAARAGRLDLVQRLAAAGADIFWASPTGANALSEILPSRAPQAPMAETLELSRVREWLTSHGLEINPLSSDSRRKLRWATGQPESWPDVPTLLELGVPLDVTGWTPLMLRIALGTADGKAVAESPPEELFHQDAWKRTPFLLAIAAGNIEMASALLDRGSDVLAKGHCGTTALHLAAKHNHCHLIDWLLAKDLPLDLHDDFGCSALHAAVSSHSVEAAALLLQNGANVHERDENGCALIHTINTKTDMQMLKLLIGAGAEVNDVSGGGDWPLKEACHAGDAATVAFLLQVGANPDLTSTGETALFSAVSSDSLECVRLLLDAGAEVNATDCDGWTCLFHLRSERVARYLLERGAAPDISDQCGGLPEDWERVPMGVRRLLRAWRCDHHQSDS